jgi:hypothetical protein
MKFLILKWIINCKVMKQITEPKHREWFSGLYNKPGKILGIFLYLIVFTGAFITFSSCVGGYVITEPSYNEVYVRPASPGIGYIWIDGDWRWNNRSHIYVHDHGYWTRPRPGRSYETGHWASGPRGKSWVRGRWNRENNASDRSHGRGNSRR